MPLLHYSLACFPYCQCFFPSGLLVFNLSVLLILVYDFIYIFFCKT